jgi:hypothetical protein
MARYFLASPGWYHSSWTPIAIQQVFENAPVPDIIVKESKDTFPWSYKIDPLRYSPIKLKSVSVFFSQTKKRLQEWSGHQSACWQKRWLALAILSVFTLLALIVTWPLIFRLSLGVPGYSQTDQLQKVWSLWYTKEALLQLSNPAYFATLAYPHGYFSPIRWSMLVIQVMAFPLTLLFSPFAAYNLALLLSYILTGYTGYLLCFDISKNRKAAMFGGLLIMLFPARVAKALAGHLESSSLFLAMLYMRSLRRTLQHPHPRRAVKTGALFALASMVHITHLPYVILPWTMIYVPQFWASRVTRPHFRATWRSLVISAGVAAIMLAPFFTPMIIFALGPFGQDAGGGKIEFSADLLSYVTPSPTNPILNALNLIPDFAMPTLGAHPQEKLAYLGIIPLILAGLALYRRADESRIWMMTGGVMMVLALGPHLKIMGEPVMYSVEETQSRIVLPYAIVSKLPIFSAGRTPGRFNLVTGVALAVLATQGATAWIEGKKRHKVAWRDYGLLTAAIFLVAEYLIVLPMPIRDEPVPAPIAILVQEPAHGAVLNIPLEERYVKHLAQYYQIIDGWPNMDGYVSRALPNEPGLLETFGWITSVAGQPDIIPMVDSEIARALLSEKDVRYVLLHRDFVTDIELESWLEKMLGPPLAKDERVALYQVKPTPNSEEIVYALAGDWQGKTSILGQPGRWLSRQAKLVIYAPHQLTGSLSFLSLSGNWPRHVTLTADGGETHTLLIGQYMRYYLTGITLHAGYNIFDFKVLEGCWLVRGDPLCSINRPLTGLALTQGCDLSFKQAQCVDMLVQDINFAPQEQIVDYRQLEVGLGDDLKLKGYALQNEALQGDGLLRVMLAWQAVSTPPEDYHFFVHLLDKETGELAAQYDGPPVLQTVETSQWLPGDIVQDQVILQEVPPGSYALLAGMYRYPSLERLAVRSERPYAQDDLIWLQDVSIGNQ